MNNDDARIGTALPPPSAPSPGAATFAPRLPPAAPTAVPKPVEPVVQRPTFTVTTPRAVTPRRKSRAGWIVLALLVAAAASVAYVVVSRTSAVTSTNDPRSTVAAPPPVASIPTIAGLSTSPCATDRVVMETAVEAWFAMLGGTTPPTEAQLASDGLLRAESSGYDITSSGEIVPAPGGPCG
ncbi:MAG: hypothetical protein JWL72_2573 [Ilumatobacteraceae bacterium]|nr:hypothetical protein [Ilumatobacteraceae bacterium]